MNSFLKQSGYKPIQTSNGVKKKILFVVTKSNFGGAQRYVYDLATNLPPNEFEVAVAFGHAPDGTPGRLVKKLVEKHIRTILVPELIRDISLLGDWRAYRALRTLFTKEKPDIVHLNSSKAGGLGALAARTCGIRTIIFTVHGWPFNEAASPASRFLRKLFSWLTAVLSTHTIVLSQNDFEQGKRFPFVYRTLHFIYNGIVTPSFLSKQDARKELRSIDPSIPEDSLWIGSVGELHPNKNYASAIDAIAFLESDVHLVIIGDGELRESLRARAQGKGVAGRVHLLGHIPDAAKYLRAFDCVVLPSEKEGLPYVLLEAGFAYMPVVASDIAGVRDIILHNFTGLLVPPNDVKGLAFALERVLRDATLSRSLSDELLKRIQKTFPLEKMIEKTIVLYDASH